MGTRRARVALVVRDERLVGRGEDEGRDWLRVGVGARIGMGRCLGASAEPALERVTGAVGEEGGHARCGEARGRLGGVVAVFVGGVAVDALPLGLAPADAPGRVSGGGREGDDMADVAGRGTERPLEDGHAAHGAPDGDRDAGHAEVVEDVFVQSGVMSVECTSRGGVDGRTVRHRGWTSAGTRGRMDDRCLG